MNDTQHLICRCKRQVKFIGSDRVSTSTKMFTCQNHRISEKTQSQSILTPLSCSDARSIKRVCRIFPILWRRRSDWLNPAKKKTKNNQKKMLRVAARRLSSLSPSSPWRRNQSASAIVSRYLSFNGSYASSSDHPRSDIFFYSSFSLRPDLFQLPFKGQGFLPFPSIYYSV